MIQDQTRGLVERLEFDAIRTRFQFSKGVASNIEEAIETLAAQHAELGRLTQELCLSEQNRDGNAAEIDRLEIKIGDMKARALAAESSLSAAVENIRFFLSA